MESEVSKAFEAGQQVSSSQLKYFLIGSAVGYAVIGCSVIAYKKWKKSKKIEPVVNATDIPTAN